MLNHFNLLILLQSENVLVIICTFEVHLTFETHHRQHILMEVLISYALRLDTCWQLMTLLFMFYKTLTYGRVCDDTQAIWRIIES